jgi:hypothetical protein
VRRTNVIENSGRVGYQPRPRISALQRLDFKVVPSWQIQAPLGGSLLKPQHVGERTVGVAAPGR